MRDADRRHLSPIARHDRQTIHADGSGSCSCGASWLAPSFAEGQAIALAHAASPAKGRQWAAKQRRSVRR